MPTKTIHDANEITTPAVGDEFPIWQIGSSAQKRITTANVTVYLESALNLAATYLALAGGTMAGAINMGGFAITNVGNVDGVDISVLKTAYDAHAANTSNPHSVTAAQANAVAKDGSIALTGDWDIGASRILKADQIKARSASGLKLYDFTTGKGLFVEDTTANVGVGTAAPTSKLHTVTASGGSRDDVVIESPAPDVTFYQTGGSANNKYWDIVVSSEQMLFRAINDANNVGGNFMVVDRTGTTIDLVNFPGTAVTIAGTLTTTGTGVFSGSLGVGVTPSTPLHVYHATTSTLRIDTVFATGAVRVDLTGADIWRSANTNDLKLGTFGGSSYMTVKGTTGYTAIGTITAPDNLLHVHNATAGSVTATSDSYIVVENSGNAAISILTPFANNGRIVFGSPSANVAGALTYDHTAGNMMFATVGFQRLYLETLQFYPTTDNAIRAGKSGNRWTEVWATNGTIQTSDERAKTDIADADLGLDFIMALRPIKWVWPDEHRPAKYEKRTVTKQRIEKVEQTERRVIEKNGKHVLTDVVELIDKPVTELKPVFHKNGKPAYETKPVLDENGNQVGTEKAQIMHAVPVIDTVEEEIKTHEEFHETHKRPHYGFASQQVKQAMDAVNAADFGGYIYDPETDTYHLKYAEFTAPMVKAIQSIHSTQQLILERLAKLEGAPLQ